jgi:hypothetical protein
MHMGVDEAKDGMCRVELNQQAVYMCSMYALRIVSITSRLLSLVA